MTETAAEIIAEGQEANEAAEETPSIEEEFRELYDHLTGAIERMESVASDLMKRGEEPVSNKDLADFYMFVSGDLGTTLRDLVQASGAAFNDAFEIIQAEGDDDDEEEEGEEEPSDGEMEIFAALRANFEAFSNMAKMPNLPAEQRTGLDRMAKVNEKAISNFYDEYGQEKMDGLYAEYVQQATEAQSGDVATE